MDLYSTEKTLRTMTWTTLLVGSLIAYSWSNKLSSTTENYEKKLVQADSVLNKLQQEKNKLYNQMIEIQKYNDKRQNNKIDSLLTTILNDTSAYEN